MNPLALIRRREKPLERQTASTSFDWQIHRWWNELQGAGFSPRLIERVGVANRCLQLNSQQIGCMPLRFFGNYEPAWVASPDPVWYPNGIGDALFAAAWSMYGWGDAFLLVTARYASGYPSAWTVLHPEFVNVQKDEGGRRAYDVQGKPLNSEDVVQITRDPRGNLRGTSALRSFAANVAGTILGSEVAAVTTPNAVLKSQKRLTKAQAEALQDQWVERTSLRRGAPAVLPPEIDFQTLAFSPADLMLLDSRQFDARQICAAFGIPPFMMNLPLEGGLTYQNPEMLGEFWWRHELRPAAMRIANALTANMLPRGSSVTFDARELLAPSFKELVDGWTAMEAAGMVTRDEFRAVVLGLPPETPEDALADLMQPPVAETSGVTGNVQPLRPTQQAAVEAVIA